MQSLIVEEEGMPEEDMMRSSQSNVLSGSFQEPDKRKNVV